MKTNLKIIGKKLILPIAGTVLILGLLIASCMKEEDVTPAPVTPMAALDQSGIADRCYCPTPPEMTKGMLVFISHGGSLNRLPAYTVTVMPNNTVIYKGIRNVGTLGTRTFGITPTQTSMVIELLGNNGFWQLQNCYTYRSDLPLYFTAMKYDGIPLKVVSDCGIAVPAWLGDVRMQIEKILGIDVLINSRSGNIAAQADK